MGYQETDAAADFCCYNGVPDINLLILLHDSVLTSNHGLILFETQIYLISTISLV